MQTDIKDKDSFNELFEVSAFLLSYSSYMFIKAINAHLFDVKIEKNVV